MMRNKMMSRTFYFDIVSTKKYKVVTLNTEK